MILAPTSISSLLVFFYWKTFAHPQSPEWSRYLDYDKDFSLLLASRPLVQKDKPKLTLEKFGTEKLSGGEVGALVI